MEHVMDTMLQFSATAASSLINAIAEGIALTACIGLLLYFFPRIKPSIRFIIWTAVMLAALAFHFVPFRSTIERSAVVPMKAFHVDAYWAVAIMAVWSIVALSRLVGLIRSAISLQRIAEGATPITLDLACETLLRSARRPVTLCTSTEVDRPSVVGFFHPRILLPQGIFSQLSSEERGQIILHEMEHLRRRDDWTNLVQKIGLALFPLNPALTWIERRLCMERELACDDCVLAATSAHKAYASCLTNLAEKSLLRRNVSLALGAWGRKPELVRRVHRILSRPTSTMGRAAGYVVAGIFLSGLTFGAVSLTRLPALVSFSASSTSATSVAPATSATNLSLPVQQNQKFSPTFVKAVMPQGPSKSSVDRTRSQHVPASKNTLRHQSRTRPQNLLVLTESDVRPGLPRLTLAISESTGSTYAALPVGNGWLVIQL
jgi:beta-lactamase regulating signal transducer with metallopeptidase domain